MLGMHAVLVATFFNLLFLMLTLRVVCTRLWWRGQRQEDSEDAQGPECPALQRVTPVVIVHPDSEVRRTHVLWPRLSLLLCIVPALWKGSCFPLVWPCV